MAEDRATYPISWPVTWQRVGGRWFWATEANEKHPTTHRHPMGMTGRPLAGGGDATPW